MNMESFFLPNISDFVDIQAAIEVAHEACVVVAPELAANAAAFASSDDDVQQQQLADKESRLQQTCADKSRELRQLHSELNTKKSARKAWKSMAEYSKKEIESYRSQWLDEYNTNILRYRSILQHLNLNMRLHRDENRPQIGKFDFTIVDANGANRSIVLEYDGAADTFELLQMVPELAIFDEISQFLRHTNDVRSVIVAWRNHSLKSVKVCTNIDSVQ